MLPNILVEIFANLKFYNRLNAVRQKFVVNELKNFIQNGELNRAKKLFKNAITYFVEDNYELVDADRTQEIYSIEGKTTKHTTIYNKLTGEFSCDCDLFNGRGDFVNKPSSCSHIDTVRLSKVR